MKDNRSGNFKSKASRFAPNCPGANIYNYPSSYLNPGPGDYSFKENQTDNNKKYTKTKGSIRKFSDIAYECKTTPSIPCNI